MTDSTRIVETFADLSARQIVTLTENRIDGEPRSASVPEGYHLRFAPSMLSGFQATDSGYTLDGVPCWRTCFNNGRRTQDGNSELGYYADEVLNRTWLLGRPIQVIDGKRALVAHRAPDGDYITGPDVGWRRFYFQASVITSEFLFNFHPPVYIEARLKLPNVAGVWPAFWLVSRSYRWPPEIDIIEAHGEGGADANADRNHYWTNHLWRDASAPNGRRTEGGWRNVAPDSIYDWATYGLLWADGRLTFSCNGRVIQTQDDHWPVADLPAYLILDVAVGGWPGRPPDSAIFPASMLIDYVRVYGR